MIASPETSIWPPPQLESRDTIDDLPNHRQCDAALRLLLMVALIACSFGMLSSSSVEAMAGAHDPVAEQHALSDPQRLQKRDCLLICALVLARVTGSGDDVTMTDPFIRRAGRTPGALVEHIVRHCGRQAVSAPGWFALPSTPGFRAMAPDRGALQQAPYGRKLRLAHTIQAHGHSDLRTRKATRRGTHRAAVRGFYKTRHADPIQPTRPQFGHRGNQQIGVGMARCGQQRAAIAVFHRLTRVQDQHLVADCSAEWSDRSWLMNM